MKRTKQFGRTQPSSLHRNKNKKSPGLKEVCWAAGFYEGEGYCYRQGRGTTVVEIQQVNEWPLNELQQFFGGAVSDHIQHYRWTLTSARARGFLYTIYSMLSPYRRAQIRKSLIFSGV